MTGQEEEKKKEEVVQENYKSIMKLNKPEMQCWRDTIDFGILYYFNLFGPKYYFNLFL